MKILAAIAAALTLAVPAHAEMDRAAEGLYRIDQAGSMRMRTQRIWRNSCYVATGLDTESYSDALRMEIVELDTIQATLLDGDVAIGLGAERSPIIRHEFENVIAPNWEQLKLYPLYIGARGSAEAEELVQVIALGDQFVTNVNGVVYALEEKYSRSSILPADQSRTLNVMGRQRMLAQRIAAQHCMVGYSDDPLAAQTELATTYSLFQASLADLMAGNLDERIVQPDPATLSALQCANETFGEVEALVEAAVISAPTTEDMARMAAASDRLLRQSNAALQIARQVFAGEEVAVQSDCVAS